MLVLFLVKGNFNMEEKVIRLYEDINYIGYLYVCQGKNDYVKRANNLLPEIKEFVEWFLSGNQFRIEEELYLALSQNLLVILEDIATATKENDTVLMLDTLEQGLNEYLTMFLPKDYFKEKRIKVYDRSAG